MSSRRIGASYFSLSDILTSQEKVPCQFAVPVLKLGFLDSSSDGDDITSGTKLELPLWLAQALAKRRNIVTCDIPKMYKLNYREVLHAEPNVVNLHKLGPHFYMFGFSLLLLDFTEKHDINECLLETFKNRFKMTMDASQSNKTIDTIEFIDKLDNFERTLFSAGRECLQNHQHWENRDDKIPMSKTMSNKKVTSFT